MSKEASATPTATLTVFRLAALFTFLAVAMGAVVCATKSGASCPTWPGCRPSQLTPQWELSPIIEFTHRVVAVSAGPLILAAAVMSLRLPGSDPLVRIFPWLSLLGAMASGVFGRMVIVSILPTPWAGVDLFCALAAMTMMAIAAVRVGTPTHAATTPSADAPQMVATARLAAGSVGVLIALYVTGIFAASKGSYTACLGWPMWRMVDSDAYPWLQVVRLGLAGLGAVLVVGTAVVAGRSERLRAWGIAVGVLFAAEMVVGVVIRSQGISNGVASAYSVLAAALLWSCGLLTAVAWAARVVTDASPAEPNERQAELADH